VTTPGRPPTPDQVRHVRRRLLRWWNRQTRDFWWRHERDPYTVAVVEILLKQTRATTVEAILSEFVRRYPTPETLLGVNEAELIDELRPFGLHRQRARHLLDFASAVMASPSALTGPTSALRELPGLGMYASTAISVFAHGRRETVIDVNVVRVFSRVWAISTPRGELRKSTAIAEVAAMFSASSRPREANWALLDLGALVCVQAQPKCEICPLLRDCDFGQRYCRTGSGSPDVTVSPLKSTSR
jgi:A/G-specific adenine glycosylase